MKKIVISALLMGMVSAASAAQVTGVLNYDMTKAPGSATASGFADSQINVRVSEDIGNGLQVSAGLGLNGAGRGETVSGTDAYVSIASGLGTVTAGQLEVANGLKARTWANAPVMGSDGVVLAAKSNLDVIKYTSPAVAGITASLSAIRAVDSTAGHTYVVGASGDFAGVNAGIDYTDSSKRVRASASTSLVGLTVGAGWSGHETGVKDSWTVSAAMPLGAVTVGAAYSDGNGTAKEVGASYALSNRTGVQLAYRDVAKSTATNGSTVRLRLTHKF